MKIILPIALAVATVGALGLMYNRPVPALADHLPSDDLLSFRIVFGERQQRTADYSGELSLSAGTVVRLAPWRFFRGDAIQGETRWKLILKRVTFENQPDRPTPLMALASAQNIVPAGVVVTVKAPSAAGVTIRTASGNFGFRLEELRHGRPLLFLDGDVAVERTPTPQRVSGPPEGSNPEQRDYPSLAVTRGGVVWIAWQGYYENGEHVYARHSTPSGWSPSFRLTDNKGDIYRTAVAEDAQGRILVIWSERTGADWHLYGRRYENGEWSERRQITFDSAPNAFHRLVRDALGGLHLVWIGYRDGKSHALWSRLAGNAWSKPVEISGAGAWMPDVASDSKGNLYVVWDSYRTGNYDIFLRRIDAGGTLGPLRQVTRSAAFQAHATVTADRQDRVWVAWDESGSNWGKDWTHEDSWRGTTLYTDRRPKVAVLEGDEWKQPAADVMAAVPVRYNRFVEQPRLACDAAGRIWLSLQVRTSSANNVSENWASGGHWERFLTSLEGEHWTPASLIPGSSTRPDGAFQLQAGPSGVWMAWAHDNRPFGGGGNFNNPIRLVHEIFAAPFEAPGTGPAPLLEKFADPDTRAAPVHVREAADIARIRAYRGDREAGALRILRGDFHRHTEVSGDGAGDGSLEDCFRYMIDAADMDTGIVADHNAGNDVEYTWWRTEKAIDLFHIRNRFTPLFGYERSVRYPNGHRNVVFAQRGVRTLPIGPDEMQGKVNSGPILYPYLRQNRGICMEHSLATAQGTDFRDNDPELEPLVELYQGYHANYEYEGAPRAETDSNVLVQVHGPLKPLGFYWAALEKRYKLGVVASSDHISTHTSYAMIYAPSDSRTDIVESMRKRHAYAATDNIVMDYRAVGADGKTCIMGDAIQSAVSPKFLVKLIGTDRIMAVDIVKDKRFVFHLEPNSSTVEFTYVDNDPGAGESYYYVRAIQIDRNMAWSSPIWVKYAGR